jgi:hypothetical protein
MKITIFGKSNDLPQPDVRFGRYSDAYKEADRYVFWDEAVLLFEQKQYTAAFQSLLAYLFDPNENNVVQRIEDGILHFELVQGSKRIIGRADTQRIVAEIDVLRCLQLGLPLMRRLMEMNYELQFCRFALLDDTIYLKYDTHIGDALPEKLYFALREMATQADKYDDLLIASFPHLVPSQHTVQLPLPDTERATKYTYLQRWIDNAFGLIYRLDSNAQAVAISYILLNTALKIDYLIVPQGSITDKIEFINELYYTDTETNIVERNNRAQRELTAIQQLSTEMLYRELYQVRATFGLASYAQPSQLFIAMGSILNDIAQCADRRHPLIAQYITECAVQFALFHLGMPTCLRHYLHLMVRCLNADYFDELGFTPHYVEASTQKLNAKALKQALSELQTQARRTFPDFSLSVSHLNFKTPLNFVQSLIAALSAATY